MEALIVIDPQIRFGRPSIRGTRITVGDVLGLLGQGQGEEEILADYPELRRQHIRACLLWAAQEADLKVAA